MTENFYAVIPAGGRCARLWPLSRSSKPRVLLPLPGPRTMIQATVDRMLPLCPASRLFVVTSERYAGSVREQAPYVCPDNVIEEPATRGSGPAIGLATAIIHQRDPSAIVGSFAADHVVTDTDAFERAVLFAIEAVRRMFVTLRMTSCVAAQRTWSRAADDTNGAVYPCQMRLDEAQRSALCVVPGTGISLA